MSAKEFVGDLPEKKLRFRSTPKIHYPNENKVEELAGTTDLQSKWDDSSEKGGNEDVKRKKDLNLENEEPSLMQFLGVELTRGYLLEHDKESYSARREKVYSFMKIPREVEKFMAYGFFQCADSFLFVYTFLPMRFILALWAVISRPILECFGMQKSKSKSILKPAEICDLLKACILIACSMMMSYIDTSMMYHLVKSQSVIKLYIFYNMLEVGDRLFSAFGQDTIDALFWTATEPRDRRREHLGVIPHLFFAVTYVSVVSVNADILHRVWNELDYRLDDVLCDAGITHRTFSVLVLFQATTLNVAINSNNKALLTIMMSNNFIELKGSVFKKFDKNNLFQVSCSDVRERFHLFVLHFIVVLQTMKEYSWKEERFWVLVPDCMMVLFAEVLVDWIKHAFITRFNELPVDVYRDYTTSLAYDMAQTRQKHAFTDHSDLVARRMGFIPLPLGVVMMRVLGHALHLDGPADILLLIISYFCLASFRVLNSIVILGKACDLITQHQQDKAAAAASPAWSRATSPVNGRPVNHAQSSVARDLGKEMRDISESTRTPVIPLQRSITIAAVPISDEKEDSAQEKPPDCTLGPAAIFSNSAVSINNVCLNPELFNKPEDEADEDLSSITDLDDGKTRSVPNIHANIDSETKDSLTQEISSTFANEDFAKKRAESEPSIPHLVDSERTGPSPP